MGHYLRIETLNHSNLILSNVVEGETLVCNCVYQTLGGSNVIERTGNLFTREMSVNSGLDAVFLN